MSPLRSLVLCLLSLGVASGFAPVNSVVHKQVQSSALNVKVDPAKYDELVADWEYQFPEFAKYGWGPSVQRNGTAVMQCLAGSLFAQPRTAKVTD